MNDVSFWKKTIRYSFFIFTYVAIGISLAVGVVWAGSYPAQNEYQQSLTGILDQDDMRWSSKPPTTQNVGVCDADCQNQAQVKVNGDSLNCDFNYTSSVNILVGLLSNNFTSTWWLNSDCQLKEGFTIAGPNTLSLVCSNIPIPAAAANGYVFWMVTGEDIVTLNWTSGVYELLFYSFQNQNQNQKPFAESISLNVDSTVPYIQQQLVGSDPNNDTITYDLVSNATGTGYSSAYVNPNTGMLYFTLEPSDYDSFSVSYRVTDGQLFSDTANVNVHVTYLSEDEKNIGRNDIAPEDYARFQLSTYNSDLLGAVGADPAQPQSIDLSSNFPAPGDQGNQNSCVGWATAYALKSYQEKVEIGWSLNTSNHLFSPAFVYNQINYGEDKGAYINEALDLAVNKGVATLSTMAYSDSDYLTGPSSAAFAEASNFKGANWYRVNDTSQIKAALVNKKPVVGGIAVYQQLMDLKGADSVYNTTTGNNQGGHAITIVGYDDNRYGGAFKVINSWSRNWGDNGYFWMPYDFTAQGILSEAYVLEDAENGTEPEPEDPTEPEPDYNTLPNLTVDSWYATYDPRPRGTGSLTYSIVNTGTGIACAGADVNLMLSANEEITGNDYYVIYETIPFELQSGESAYRDQENSISFQFPDQLESGTYFLALWVDDMDVVVESNENDNISIGDDLISITNSLPDISVNTWYAEWDSDGDGTLTYEVINNGASATTSTEWDINLVLDPDQNIGNGNEIILFYENANYFLDPDEYIYRDEWNPAYFNLYQDTFGDYVPSGTYFLALWVDDLNEENESNELNNGSYSWGTVSVYGYGIGSDSGTDTSNSNETVVSVQNKLTGKAYNGKKLPPKNLVMRKVQVTKTESGKTSMKFLDQGETSAKKGVQAPLPTKRVSSSANLIFPSGKKMPMPHRDGTNGK